MPITGKRETILAIGAAIGVAVSWTAQAEPRQPSGNQIQLAQNNDDREDERRKRRHEQQQQQQQRQEHQQPQRQERSNPGRDHSGGGGGDSDRQRVQQQQQQQPDNRDDRRERKNADREQRQKGRAQQQQEQQNQQERRRDQVDKERANREAEREKAVRDRREQADKAREEKNRNRKDRADDRRDRKDDNRGRADDKGNSRDDRAGDRRDRPANRADDRRERIDERIKNREITREELQDRRDRRREFSRGRLKDITRGRKERREAGGRIVIEEPDRRRIIRDNGRVIIEHDERERLRGAARDVRTEKGPHGRNRTIITRPNGVQIISVEDNDGRLIRRIKRFQNGREVILINNDFEGRGRYRDRGHRRGPGFYVDLPDITVDLRNKDYYLYADDADEGEIEDLLTAPPVDDLEDDYTLDEIRYSPGIRKRLRKLNLNTVNFEFGSWEIREGEIDKLSVVARVINRILRKNPDEVFMIAGHTDAVGSDEDNLSLSDRRAETVARVLTDEFGVPPENLVTQGYGESDLLIDTDQAEIRNRRVDFMRITPFLAQKEE